MSTSKRKSFAKALSQKIGEIPTVSEPADEPSVAVAEQQSPPLPESPPATESPRQEPEPVKFTKFTFPLREDLHRQLSKTIARLNLERDVEVSMAILIRLGIEHVLEQLEQDPDALLASLYQLEQKEVALSGDKKYTVNRGLAEYIHKVRQKAGNT